MKGSSDEFFVFYADSVEGLDSLTYKLNVRTGTVTDGTSGMPLCNILVASPNLNNLDIDSYKASVEKIVSPLIIDKGYTINGLKEVTEFGEVVTDVSDSENAEYDSLMVDIIDDVITYRIGRGNHLVVYTILCRVRC